jgi:hypothetical protein
MKKLSELNIGDSVQVESNHFNISGNISSFDRIVKSINKRTIIMNTDEEFCIITGKNILGIDNIFNFQTHIVCIKSPDETEFFFPFLSKSQFKNALTMEHNAVSIDHYRGVMFFKSEYELSTFSFLFEINS